MPRRNFGKGGKRHKKNKRRGVRQKVMDIDPQNGIMYAIVTKRQGGKFLDVKCTDGTTKKCHISGKFWNKVFCNPGDIIVVSLRNDMGSDNTCDLCAKPDQASIKKELSSDDRETLFGKNKNDIFDRGFEENKKETSIWDTDNNVSASQSGSQKKKVFSGTFR